MNFWDTKVRTFLLGVLVGIMYAWLICWWAGT